MCGAALLGIEETEASWHGCGATFWSSTTTHVKTRTLGRIYLYPPMLRLRVEQRAAFSLTTNLSNCTMARVPHR